MLMSIEQLDEYNKKRQKTSKMRASSDSRSTKTERNLVPHSPVDNRFRTQGNPNQTRVIFVSGRHDPT